MLPVLLLFPCNLVCMFIHYGSVVKFISFFPALLLHADALCQDIVPSRVLALPSAVVMSVVPAQVLQNEFLWYHGATVDRTNG